MKERMIYTEHPVYCETIIFLLSYTHTILCVSTARDRVAAEMFLTINKQASDFINDVKNIRLIWKK